MREALMAYLETAIPRFDKIESLIHSLKGRLPDGLMISATLRVNSVEIYLQSYDLTLYDIQNTAYVPYLDRIVLIGLAVDEFFEFDGQDYSEIEVMEHEGQRINTQVENGIGVFMYCMINDEIYPFCEVYNKPRLTRDGIHSRHWPLFTLREM